MSANDPWYGVSDTVIVGELKRENAALRATVAEQAQALEQARQLFYRFLISSREDAEGDCKYCECEIGTDRANDCYDDCIMNDVRAWLAAQPEQQVNNSAKS